MKCERHEPRDDPAPVSRYSKTPVQPYYCIGTISNEKNAPEMTATPQTGAGQKDAPALVEKIGKTTHVVRVHFSKTSREIMCDKIKRMLRNEIVQM